MKLYEGKEFDHLIKPIMLPCRVMGVWPLEDDAGFVTRFFRRIHIALMFLIMTIQLLAIICDAVRQRNDLNETAECLLVGSAFFLTLFRLIAFSTHTRDMDYVVKTMRADWSVTDYTSKSIFREKCYLVYKIVKIFITAVALTSIMFVIAPIIQMLTAELDKSALPFRGYYFMNHTVSPNFEVLYIINAISGILGCNTIVSATPFSLICVMHGAVKFYVLQKKLESIKDINETTNRKLKQCLKDHQEAIRYADAIERLINIIELGQFLISSGLLCCAGFQLTSMLNDKHRLIKYALFTSSAFSEMYLFSFSGQQLINESSKVADAAYNCYWTNMKLGLCKNIAVIILRSQNFCKITAGKFYTVSLESIAAILSTSFSYFTMLIAMNDDEAE